MPRAPPFPGRSNARECSGHPLVVLERTGQVRVTGTRPGDSAFRHRLARDFTGRHDLFPVRPVAILDHHGDRTADRFAVPHPGKKTDLILLDLHPAAATVTALPAFQLMIDKLKIDGKVSGNALHKRD